MIRFEGGRWEDWEDDLTIPRLQAIQKGWEVDPPVDVLVAAFLGYKPKKSGSESIEEFVCSFPTGLVRATTPPVPR